VADRGAQERALKIKSCELEVKYFTPLRVKLVQEARTGMKSWRFEPEAPMLFQVEG
jgi:hypothetical protein